MTGYRSPLLELPGAVAAEPPDDGVAAHLGDPLAEQRAMARRAAVVDRSHREVLAVPGEDRLSWLHLLLTQHVSELAPETGTEALVLDHNGRVLHHMSVAQAGDTVWLDAEAGGSAELLDYLAKMVFWSKVEPRDATAEVAVLSVVGPDTAAVLTAAGVPAPAGPHAVTPLPGGGFAHRLDWPGVDVVDLLVPRDDLVTWWQKLRAAGAAGAGTLAHEALRVEARRPRLGLDTDERTIPHEVDWIPSAVHLAKGCYRGQETVARVANLGRPPRRLVLLHLESGDEDLPASGDAVALGGRTVGRIGTAVLHHELGGVALALVKRSVGADAELVVGAGEDAAPARIDPDSVTEDDGAPRPGRAAQLRAGRPRPS
jgi:tRNA-modifying protein YgfZ